MAAKDCVPVIAAKLRGPGPAKYRLPGTVGSKDHDPTKHKDPAFSFGMRLNIQVGNFYTSTVPH